jgi:hypothetical protein
MGEGKAYLSMDMDFFAFEKKKKMENLEILIPRPFLRPLLAAPMFAICPVLSVWSDSVCMLIYHHHHHHHHTYMDIYRRKKI